MDPVRTSRELRRLASYIASADHPDQEEVVGRLRRIGVAIGTPEENVPEIATQTFEYSLEAQESDYGEDPYAVGPASFMLAGVKVPAETRDDGRIFISFDALAEPGSLELHEEDEAAWRQKYLDSDYDWNGIVARLESDHGDRIRQEGRSVLDAFTGDLISSQDTYD